MEPQHGANSCCCLPYYLGLHYTPRRWFRSTMLGCLALTVGPMAVALLSGLEALGMVTPGGLAFEVALVAVASAMFGGLLGLTIWFARATARASAADGESQGDAMASATAASGLGCLLYTSFFVWAMVEVFAPGASNVARCLPVVVVLGALSLISCFGVAVKLRDGSGRDDCVVATVVMLTICLVLVLFIVLAILVALKLDGSLPGWSWRVVFIPAWILESVVLCALLLAIPLVHMIPTLLKANPMPEEAYAVMQIVTSVCLCLFLPPTVFQILVCLTEDIGGDARAGGGNQSKNHSSRNGSNSSGGSSNGTASGTTTTTGAFPGVWVASPIVLGWTAVLVLVGLCRLVSWCSRHERFMRRLNGMSEDAFCRDLLRAAEREEKYREDRDAKIDRDIRRYLRPDFRPGAAAAAGPGGPGGYRGLVATADMDLEGIEEGKGGKGGRESAVPWRGQGPASPERQGGGGGGGGDDDNGPEWARLMRDPGVSRGVRWVGEVAAMLEALANAHQKRVQQQNKKNKNKNKDKKEGDPLGGGGGGGGAGGERAEEHPPRALRLPLVRARVEAAVLEKQKAGLWSGPAQARYEALVVPLLGLVYPTGEGGAGGAEPSPMVAAGIGTAAETVAVAAATTSTDTAQEAQEVRVPAVGAQSTGGDGSHGGADTESKCHLGRVPGRVEGADGVSDPMDTQGMEDAAGGAAGGAAEDTPEDPALLRPSAVVERRVALHFWGSPNQADSGAIFAPRLRNKQATPF